MKFIKLWVEGPKNCGLIPIRDKAVFLLCGNQTRSGVHLAIHGVNRGQVPGIEWPGHQADHLRLVLRLRMHGAVSPLPNFSSSQGQFYLYLCCTNIACCKQNMKLLILLYTAFGMYINPMCS
jgi:hypothetical protein